MMRRAMLLIGAWVLLGAGGALAQTKPTRPTQPLGPVPSGEPMPTQPLYQTAQPARGILFIPQFAPPGTQVPGGPPASNTPTQIAPTVLGIN